MHLAPKSVILKQEVKSMTKDIFKAELETKMPKYKFIVSECKDSDPLFIVINKETNVVMASFLFGGELIYKLRFEGTISQACYLIKVVKTILEKEE